MDELAEVKKVTGVIFGTSNFGFCSYKLIMVTFSTFGLGGGGKTGSPKMLKTGKWPKTQWGFVRKKWPICRFKGPCTAKTAIGRVESSFKWDRGKSWDIFHWVRGSIPRCQRHCGAITDRPSSIPPLRPEHVNWVKKLGPEAPRVYRYYYLFPIVYSLFTSYWLFLITVNPIPTKPHHCVPN